MLRIRRASKPIFLQNKTGKADAKSVWIGGEHPIVVQSMTTTDTADADATLEQIYGLAMEGCEVVRVTVKDPPDAAGLPRDRSSVAGADRCRHSLRPQDGAGSDRGRRCEAPFESG